MFTKLAAVIKSNDSLEQLWLCHDNLYSSMIHALQALHGNSKLNLLNVYVNFFTEETGNVLDFVPYQSNLRLK